VSLSVFVSAMKNLIFEELNMRIFSRIMLCILVTIAGQGAWAQTRPTVSQALDFWIANTEMEVTSAAEAMPEAKYSFAPTSGEFTGARTFGQQISHLAANNYRMAAYIMAATPSPEQESETGPEAVRSKAQIMAYLKGSFAALHRAVSVINQKNMLEPMTLQHPSRQNTRLQFAVDAVAHSYDHYGQMVEYLRMNGIVPPASRR
jgi:DinB family protein